VEKTTPTSPDAPERESGHSVLGAVTQDDPLPAGLKSLPDAGAQGDVTFVAVFENITGADACADDLGRREPDLEVMLVSRRGDGPEQGLQPGNVITGEDQSPPKDRDHLGSGVAVGASIGATAGLLAATYFIPGLGSLVATGSLVSTLAGAGLGSFLGGLVEYVAADPGDDASIYPGQVRRGGVLLLARVASSDADRVRRLIEFWNPLEIRVQ